MIRVVRALEFLGSSLVVKILPSNAGDTSSIWVRELRFHMLGCVAKN